MSAKTLKRRRSAPVMATVVVAVLSFQFSLAKASPGSAPEGDSVQVQSVDPRGLAPVKTRLRGGMAAARRYKPAWPSPESRCIRDRECEPGLVCEPIDGYSIEDFLENIPPEDVPPDTPLIEGQAVCQPGCRIDDQFRTPDEIDAFPDNCQSCQPGASTTDWTPRAAGVVCDPGSGDVCDPDEVCNGTDAMCPDDSYATAGTVCREGSGDVCDPDETCPGTPDTACPPDEVADAGYVCNAGSGDACDPDEVCSGVAGEACPDDSYASAETVCREGSGDVCDPDETCPGTPDASCPPDEVAEAGTACREGSGDACDPDEVCSGEPGDACPDDVVTAAGTVCNEGSGDDCDPDEVCSGVAGEACPDDSYAGSNVVCRPATGDCDVADYCPGVAGAACSSDEKRTAGHECRAAVGPCDEAESCDGTSNQCPPDAYRASDQICRFAGATDGGVVDPRFFACDEPEYCTGSSPDCPEDAVKAAGTVCRAIGGVCDTAAETCDGVGKGCPLDVNIVSPDPCRPAAGPCDEPEFCSAGDPAYPHCPADGVKLYGTVCRPAAPAIFPIVAACDIVEVCDGVSVDCPANERLSEGDACVFEGADGTCEQLANGPLGCVVRGDLPLGAACTSNQDCQSLHCGETRDIGRVCMAEDEVGFGETCDGDGFRLAGDPNGRQCTSRGGALNCCRAGNIPNVGETGTCLGCCRDDDLPDGLTIGCGSGVEPACCGGRCTDVGTDPYNCGQCGTNCYDGVGACRPSVISCGDEVGPLPFHGECVYSAACGAGQACYDWCDLCWFFGNCDSCESGAHCIDLVVSASTLCNECNSDDDCSGNERCFSGCGGGFNIFCFEPSYCAESPDQCGG